MKKPFAYPSIRQFFNSSVFHFLAFFVFLGSGIYTLQFLSSNDVAEPGEVENSPLYFKQWFESKADANGEIPAWLRQDWYEYDKRKRVSIRANQNPFDTIVEMGPFSVGGRTRALWIDPRNEKIMLAGAISGGVWRSENGGANWKPLDEHQISMMPSCITSNPFNPDEVYYGTGEARANSADVDGNGVFYSSDGGKTFSQLASTIKKIGFNEIWDIEHSKSDSNTVYVGTNTQGLFRTSDHGTTWKNVYNGGNKLVTDVLAFPTGRVLAAMQSNQVYASNSGDSGTFSIVKFPNMPAGGTYRRIQMGNCAKFPNVAYAIFEGFDFNAKPVRFYKSSDYGNTWIEKTIPIEIGASYQSYCLMLGVSPIDSNLIVCGGVNIAYSTSGGNNWSTFNIGHTDHHSFQNLPQTNNEFIVGTDGGIFKYRWNNDNYIANLNNGYRITQFYAGAFHPSVNSSIGGAQDNGTQVVAKPFVSKSFFGGDGAYCHIGLEDGTIAYLSYQNATAMRMDNFNVNNPSSTSSISIQAFTDEGVDFINLYAMAPDDQTALYYRTNKSLYRSTDMGNSWEKMNTVIRAGIKAIGISKGLNPVVYFGGTSAQMYKIEKGITSAPGKEVNYNNYVPAAVTNDYIKGLTVHPQNPYVVFVALSNISAQPRVWKVTGLDSATNKPVWTNISGDLPPSLPVNMMAVDPRNPDQVFFAGTDFGLYYSLDSGKTWTKEYRVPNVAIHEVKMRDDGYLYLFTHGRGMWSLKLKEMNFGATRKIESKLAVSIWPNPANNYLMVKGADLLLSGDVGVKYQIIDVTGKVTLHGILQGDATANTNSQVATNPLGGMSNSINIESLRPGYYFIQLEGRGKRKTEKFIVSK